MANYMGRHKRAAARRIRKADALAASKQVDAIIGRKPVPVVQLNFQQKAHLLTRIDEVERAARYNRNKKKKMPPDVRRALALVDAYDNKHQKLDNKHQEIVEKAAMKVRAAILFMAPAVALKAVELYERTYPKEKR